jgi:serine/threonine protein phosphatase PrpC
MEDRHVVIREGDGGRPATFCGVYDGHGGAAVARLAAERLHDAFLGSLREGAEPREAFVLAYAAVAEAAAGHALMGTTACTAWITDSDLTVAWVGDSQLALVTPDGPRLVTPAHRATEPGELARIRSMGGQVEGPYLMRGQHGVMVARAFGDTWFHPVGLVATPSIVTAGLPRAGTPYLIVLATDGLWDVVRPATVADLFRECLLRAEGRATDYARLLVDLALTEGSSDNITVVTVADLPDDPDASEIVGIPPGEGVGVDQTRGRAPLRDHPRGDRPAPGRSPGRRRQRSLGPAGSGPLSARQALGGVGGPHAQGAPAAAQGHAGGSRRHPGGGRRHLLRWGTGDSPPRD